APALRGFGLRVVGSSGHQRPIRDEIQSTGHATTSAKSASAIGGTAIRTPRLIVIPARAFPGELLRPPDAVTSWSIHPSFRALLGPGQEVFITNSRSQHRFRTARASVLPEPWRSA